MKGDFCRLTRKMIQSGIPVQIELVTKNHFFPSFQNYVIKCDVSSHFMRMSATPVRLSVFNTTREPFNCLEFCI
jgi:hypothetical protein